MTDGEKQKPGPRTTDGKRRALNNLATRWRHGVYGALPAAANRSVQEKVQELRAALEVTRAGAIQPADEFAVTQTAICLYAVDLLVRYMEANRSMKRADAKEAWDLLRGLQDQVRKWLVELGATPMARQKLSPTTGKPKSWLAAMHEGTDEAEDKV